MAKFVVLRGAFCKLRGDFGFFCSVNHFSEGGVNANHNVMCLPSLAENDSRLLTNSEGNRDGEWIYCPRKEADVALFLQVTRMGKIIKNLQSKLNWSIIARKRTITKQWIILKCETNKTDQNSPITNHKSWLFELVQVNMCFLRGLLRWLMEQ